MKQLVTIFMVLISLSTFSQINNEHLEVGEKAPVIRGTDQFGNAINSETILKDQKILLLFYRGNWCPFCRKHLKELQDNLEALKAKGYYVLVVSPEKMEKTKETSEMVDATFSILHDANSKIMNDYKVAFQVNEMNVLAYLDATKAKIAEYNDVGNDNLPVPATYIIGKDGKIAFVHYDPDYKKRFDIKEIIAM